MYSQILVIFYLRSLSANSSVFTMKHCHIKKIFNNHYLSISSTVSAIFFLHINRTKFIDSYGWQHFKSQTWWYIFRHAWNCKWLLPSQTVWNNCHFDPSLRRNNRKRYQYDKVALRFTYSMKKGVFRTSIINQTYSTIHKWYWITSYRRSKTYIMPLYRLLDWGRKWLFPREQDCTDYNILHG